MTPLGVHILLNEEDHTPTPGHPENIQRLLPIVSALEYQLTTGQLSRFERSSYGLAPIHRVHSPQYIQQLQRACESGEEHLDVDTYITTGSFRAACEVVNSVLSAVDTVMTTATHKTFVLGRPPGHHCEYSHAMGFCLINNIAVAAQYAVDSYFLKRIAIIDFDVHHGNGTQHLFYDRDDVFFISTHQFPAYPGTGTKAESGTGRGNGFTLNIPLAPGTGNSGILAAFGDQILPALNHYEPDLLLVSAGFDAHRLDPLADLDLTGDAYRTIARSLNAVADQYCNGRVVSILEGGYSPEGNLDAISNYIDGLKES